MDVTARQLVEAKAITHCSAQPCTPNTQLILAGLLDLGQILHSCERRKNIVYIALIQTQHLADLRHAQRLLLDEAVEHIQGFLHTSYFDLGFFFTVVFHGSSCILRGQSHTPGPQPGGCRNCPFRPPLSIISRCFADCQVKFHCSQYIPVYPATRFKKTLHFRT